MKLGSKLRGQGTACAGFKKRPGPARKDTGGTNAVTPPPPRHGSATAGIHGEIYQAPLRELAPAPPIFITLGLAPSRLHARRRGERGRRQSAAGSGFDGH